MTQVNFYSKEQIDEREIGEPTDSASSTGSLWARIKNAVARIVSLETADTNNVKKTGTSTVTGDVQVPTTPATPTSVVNSAYVNDATVGVNNILHKTGNETFYNTKKTGTSANDILLIESDPAVRKITIKSNTMDFTDPSAIRTGAVFTFSDKNDYAVAWLYAVQYTDGTTGLVVKGRNSDGSEKTTVISKGDVIS